MGADSVPRGMILEARIGVCRQDMVGGSSSYFLVMNRPMLFNQSRILPDMCDGNPGATLAEEVQFQITEERYNELLTYLNNMPKENSAERFVGLRGCVEFKPTYG